MKLSTVRGALHADIVNRPCLAHSSHPACRGVRVRCEKNRTRRRPRLLWFVLVSVRQHIESDESFVI